MNKRLVAVAALAFLTASAFIAGCGGPFVRQDFEGVYKPRIKKVAILPFKNITTNKEAEAADIALREGIYSELKRKDYEYTVVIQEIAETDKIYSQAGINPLDPSQMQTRKMTNREIGELLGVDAVMQGTLIKYHEKGKTGQWVTLLLFGSATGAEVITRVGITDCNSSTLLWDWEVQAKGGFLTSPESVANNVGRSIAKKWPFKKKK